MISTFKNLLVLDIWAVLEKIPHVDEMIVYYTGWMKSPKKVLGQFSLQCGQTQMFLSFSV